MSRELKRLVYLSLRQDADASAIEHMVSLSASRNAADGLTGAIVYDNRHFVQMLEGDHDALARCFLRIARSRLHHRIEIGAFTSSAVRLFVDWSMRAMPVARQAPPLSRTWTRIMREPEELRMTRFEAAFLEWALPKS